MYKDDILFSQTSRKSMCIIKKGNCIKIKLQKVSGDVVDIYIMEDELNDGKRENITKKMRDVEAR